MQGSEQTTNQSSLEIRWNSKPEDQIQWVVGLYSFLDYNYSKLIIKRVAAKFNLNLTVSYSELSLKLL